VSLRFLLDTTIVSAPISSAPDRRIVRRLEQHSLQCAIAAPVWHELVYGCSRLPAGKRRTALEEYLRAVVHRSFPVVPYDEAAAALHGRERARLEAIGKPVPFVDGQIAAIAVSQNLMLVTTNARHFRSFKGLAVADWTR
jgi:tRNA(fMet)-specific endonuclease VapC